MWSIALLPALLAPPQEAPAAPAPDPRHRQFDFWIGEWSVLNRHMDEGGTWRAGDTTRARITPVCGGNAILEEWAGPFRGTFMNGFSLRAFDPAAEDWNLLLFWTTDGHGGFGTLRGGFRHGRGEFFTTRTGDRRTRYSFTDTLQDTIRWDSATTEDGGVTWRTDWIMEFDRTRAAEEVTVDRVFAEDWTEGDLSPLRGARRLDWLVGTWVGEQETDDGRTLEARLRCKLLSRGCLVLDVLETRAPGATDWDERLTVRGVESRPGARSARWAAWTVAEHDTVLRSSVGRADDDAMVFERTEPDGTRVTETVEPVDGNELRLVVERTASDGTAEVTATTLARARSGGR